MDSSSHIASRQDKLSSSNIGDKELECPVCFEVPHKEIFQCKNGHMICGSCSSKVDSCPQCRCNFKMDGGLIRNRFAEALVTKINNPGQTSAYGAQERVTQTSSVILPAKITVVGYIQQMDSGNKKVEGNVQGTVSQLGSGELQICGNVYGDISQMGSGILKIVGSVQGNVLQMGSGVVHVQADVNGNISMMGSGTLKVHGSVRGKVSLHGSGVLFVHGDVYGGISKMGLGKIITGGVQYEN